ncbi:MAG TPA: ATP-binding protein [Vicinamibacteria bacterium]|nr:ATP-binding protein [Vicinamibacteria bacterium]
MELTVTEPRRDRRRDTAAHMRAVLDGALEAVIGMDATGLVTFWNPSATHMFGWSREEALGQALADLIIPEPLREAHQRGLDRFVRTGETALLNRRLEVRGRHKDGSEFPVELAVTPLREGEFVTFHAFIRDITEQKQAEEEREGLLADTKHARDQAEAASRAKDQFLATLSHELRTPLTSIVGWVYLLRSGQLDSDTVNRGLETIERNAMLQAQLVSDILDMSRIIAARFRLVVRPVDLTPLVAAAIDSLMPAARAKNLHVQPILDPSAGRVLGDPDRLQQVFWNLLSNAIKFTPEGGRVQVKLAVAEGSAEVTVEDDGVGIPSDFLSHVFELFRQRDSSNTRAHGGLGLGLSVVRHLVELHGGTVRAESAGEGKGARFAVRLPLLREGDGLAAHPDPAPPADVEPPVPDLPSLEGVGVLVVDAGAAVREVITDVLRRSGARVEGAGTAQEGLETVVRARPDVILTELDLPDESGYALLRKVRSLPDDAGGRTPAAVITTRARVEDRVEALLAGFQMHLDKPVRPAELVAVVANLAGRTRAR